MPLRKKWRDGSQNWRGSSQKSVHSDENSTFQFTKNQFTWFTRIIDLIVLVMVNITTMRIWRWILWHAAQGWHWGGWWFLWTMWTDFLWTENCCFHHCDLIFVNRHISFVNRHAFFSQWLFFWFSGFEPQNFNSQIPACACDPDSMQLVKGENVIIWVIKDDFSAIAFKPVNPSIMTLSRHWEKSHPT